MKNKSEKKNLRNKSIIEVKPSISKNNTSIDENITNKKNNYNLFLFACLIGLLLFVFFFLPSFVSQENFVEETSSDQSELYIGPIESSEYDNISQEEISALRSTSEDLLSEILTQQSQINNLSPNIWANDKWLVYLDQINFGDDAFLSESFKDSIRFYQDAIFLGKELLDISTSIVEVSNDYGNRALATGDYLAAIDQFNLVLQIEKDNAIAIEGLGRAENLPEVINIMSEARSKQLSQEYELSIKLYSQVLEIDPKWQDAKNELNLVIAIVEKNSFDNFLSNAYTSLGAGDFNEANNFFNQALLLRPESEEVKNGILQAEQGAKFDAVRLFEARALAFEKRELWERVIEIYEEILTTDPNLEFAKDGLQRSRLRDDLDKKINNLIDNPRLLFDDNVLDDSGYILLQALEIDQPGPRITEQQEKLENIIRLASTPINIVINSDNLTDIVLYRKGSLGKFDTKTIELRPGNYTIVGNRNGYRDVRLNFEILPGLENMNIAVECKEKI